MTEYMPMIFSCLGYMVTNCPKSLFCDPYAMHSLMVRCCNAERFSTTPIEMFRTAFIADLHHCQDDRIMSQLLHEIMNASDSDILMLIEEVKSVLVAVEKVKNAKTNQ